MAQVSLRNFPATPPGGEVDGLEWIQSMGRITLSCPMEADVKEEDIEVKLAGFQIEVYVRETKLASLSKELQDLVRPAPASWWILTGSESAPTLVIQLMKLKHSAWGGPWFTGQLHPKKKGRFWWNSTAQKAAEEEMKLIKLNQYEVMLPGRPDDDDTAWYPPTPSNIFTPISDKYLCSPDDLVLGTKVSQDKRFVYLSIHFDNEALEYFANQVPYEDLFAADIGQQTLYLFIRGDDQNPIINATLTGVIEPDAVTWKMATDETFRSRQRLQGSPSPALIVTMPKNEAHCYEWDQIFQACWQHRLMVKNLDEYEDCSQAAEQLQWIDDSMDPASREELQQKADKLQSWQEERFNGIPEAMTFRRSGYDIDSTDYWENVYDYVKGVVMGSGYDGAPKVLAVSDM